MRFDLKRKERTLTPQQAIRARRVALLDRKEFMQVLKKLLILCVAVYVLFGVLFGLAVVKGSDMQPKLSAGDVVLYWRRDTSYMRGDVVVIKRDGAQYIGRVIGLPNETIEITAERTVKVNGQAISENDIFYETEAFQQAVQYPLELGENEYFLLGDKRDSAKDSRYFGVVKQDEIEGTIIASLHRSGI